MEWSNARHHDVKATARLRGRALVPPAVRSRILGILFTKPLSQSHQRLSELVSALLVRAVAPKRIHLRCNVSIFLVRRA